MKSKITAILAASLLAMNVFAQNTYETASVNTDNNGWWADPNVAFPDTYTLTWDTTSAGGPAPGFDPGSNINGSGALDDRVVIGRFFASNGARWQAQNYRLQQDAGTIAHVTIGSPNSTVFADYTPASTADWLNGQIQLQVRESLTVTGDASGEAFLLGVTGNQSGVNVQNGTGNLNIRGDLNFDPDSIAPNNDIAPHFLRLDNENATLNVGGNINGYKGISLQFYHPGTFIMDTTGDGVTDTGAQTFELNQLGVANADTGASDETPDRTIVQTFGEGKTIRAWIAEVGKRTNENAGVVDGTLIFDGATAEIRSMNIGMQTNTAPVDSAFGTVVVGNGSVLTTGTPNGDGTYGGNIILGQKNTAATSGGAGTMTINDGGTVNARSTVYLGGDSTRENWDFGTSGTLNVNAGGTLNVGQISTNAKNLEIGRGGDGTLVVNGGAVNVGFGNLVIGQSSAVANPDNGVLASPNKSRGTVIFEGGAQVEIGSAATDGNSNLNFNQGGGDVTHTGPGTTVSIENNLNFQSALAATDVAASDNPDSSYAIDNGVLAIGNNLNAGNNLAGTNTFTIRGDQGVVTVGNNLNIGDAGFVLEFDFMGGSSISALSVDNVANLTTTDAITLLDESATLLLSNDGVLDNYSGDLVLLNIVNGTNGEFANAPSGTVFGGYKIAYDYDTATGTAGAGGSVALISNGAGVVLACDLDSDGDCDQSDIDLLYDTDPSSADITNWLTQASDPANPYKTISGTVDDIFVLGDLNLDGNVDSTDLGLLLNNYNSETGVTWDGGDLNADDIVNSTDLGLLLNNFNFNSAATSAAVPEPSGLVLLLVSAMSLLATVRRRTR